MPSSSSKNSSSKKRKKTKSSKKKRKRSETEGGERVSKKSKLAKKPLTEEQKKVKREQLKKLPGKPGRRSKKKNEAVEDLRKLTKARVEGLKMRPLFLGRKAREDLSKKEVDDKQKKFKKKEEEIKKLRSAYRRGDGYRREEVRESRRDRERTKVNDRSQTTVEASEKELDLIKQAYLGKKKKKKQTIPPSQKFKFNFDWDASEDTSEKNNNLYKNRHKISLMVGSGSFGGYDLEEQKKTNKETWRKLAGRTELKLDKYSGGLYDILKARREAKKIRDKEKKERIRRDYRHWKKKKLSEMTPRDWRILKEDFRISTKFGGKLPSPIRFWAEAGLPDSIMKSIRDAGYTKPYPIQRQAIPVGLTNRDCVGIAETGSGKTAAFVIPMLVYILQQPPMNRERAQDGPYALILAPTRELATQINGEVAKFAEYLDIKCMTIVGGVDIHMQSALAAHGMEVIIATPGRLLDSLNKRFLVLNQCKYIVLDEADRMIDMNFAGDIESIMDRMPVSNLRPLEETDENSNEIYRQTFMFTATMPNEVQRLSRKYLRNPVYITIGDPNKRAAANVTQHVIWTTDSQKRKVLQELMDSKKVEPPIMIFTNMRKACDTLVRYLRDQDIRGAEALHGGKSQEIRQIVLKKFHDGIVDVLVCTDVAGRGIDVKGVQAVINYDMARSVDDYCHRIGRTGRAEEKGEAFTLLTEHDHETFYDLRQLLLAGDFSIPRELDHHPEARRKPGDHNKHKKIIYK